MSGSIRASAGVEFINDRFSRVGAFTPSFSAVTPTIGASASFDAEAYLEPDIHGYKQCGSRPCGNAPLCNLKDQRKVHTPTEILAALTTVSLQSQQTLVESLV